MRSLQPLIDPEHVVVIGAGSAEKSAGRRILAHLQTSFSGRVDVVHPSMASVAGVAAVANVGELDRVPDLAIVAVPARDVTSVVDACGAFGVPCAVVIAAGFAEVGNDGARMQADLLGIARRHGMRLVGPNCLGVVSTGVGLDAMFTSQTFRPGGIAVASQSGGVGIAIAAEAERRHAGISSFVSMGNKLDVSGNDLMRLWADDPYTRVILLYLESFGDPMRFRRVGRAVSRRKPVVALASGWSGAGRRGAASHTAALATDRSVVDALLRHTGVIAVDTLDELIDVGVLLDGQPPPGGPQVALIGNAGGPLILAADAAGASSLAVPELSDEIRDEIARLAPDAASTVNPVDLSAAVTPDRIAAVVDAVAASGEVDACVVVYVEVAEHGADDLLHLLAAADVARTTTLAVTLLGPGDPPETSLPVFPTPDRAVRALALAATRSAWLAAVEEEHENEPLVDGSLLMEARRIARRHLERAGADHWLHPDSCYTLLETAGIPVARWHYVQSAQECGSVCGTVGDAWAIKADVAGVVHKSDSRGVALDVRGAPAATAVFDEMQARFGEAMRGALVQEYVPPGAELLVGITRDVRFGPLIVVGAGGTEAELRDDRTLLVAPTSMADARRAVESLRMAPLFNGFRGRPALPVDNVIELVHRVGMLAAAVPEIDQLDLNPVILTVEGCSVVDGRVAVVEPPSPVTPARAMRS